MTLERETAATDVPAISVVIPCRNERRHIEACLISLLGQESPPDGFEVIVADGMSDDGTREVLERLSTADPRLRVVDNLQRVTPCGMNAGIRASRGRFIAILGAHNRYAPDYLRRCLEEGERTEADNVGGGMIAEGEGYVGRAIAAAHHSPFAVGGARWHNPHYEGPVDTVFGGFYRREVFERIGLFDEELVRNQDDEFNLRLTRAGGTIWHSPYIRSWYRPRNSLFALYNQYWQYGYWKVRVIQKHRLPASVRHLVPGAFVATLLGLLLATPVFRPALWAEVALVGLYATGLVIASLQTALRSDYRLLPILPAVFCCYHLAYGVGFLCGLWDFVICRKEAKAREHGPGRPFFRKVSLLLGGVALGQAAILLVTPILTRLYRPEDFGLLAVYASLVSILLVVVCLRYEPAITLPEDRAVAVNLLILCLLLVLVISGLCGLGSWLFREQIALWMNEPGLRSYLWLLPLGLLGGGCYQALSFWALRQRWYEALAKTKVTQGIAQASSQVGLGLLPWGPVGLLVGDVLGRACGSLKLASLLWRREEVPLREVSPAAMAAAAMRYWRFPLLSAGATLLNSLGLRLPLLLFSAFYGSEVTGDVALGLALFSLSGVGMVSQATAQVYIAEASRLTGDTEGLSGLFWRTAQSLGILALFLGGVVGMFASWVFPLVFGPDWEDAGLFAQILSPFFALQLLTSPLNTTLDVIGRQDLLWVREVVRLGIPGIALVVCGVQEWSPPIAVATYSITGSCAYIFAFIVSWYAIRRSKNAGVAREVA
jgi:O-antigen/teichoic acid export membrane protein/glycosyltransferase involved in cell wall biosynthesis